MKTWTVTLAAVVEVCLVGNEGEESVLKFSGGQQQLPALQKMQQFNLNLTLKNSFGKESIRIRNSQARTGIEWLLHCYIKDNKHLQ